MNGHLAFNRGKIHYSDTGTGPAIVLLHGFLESLEIWDDFTKELSKEFRIIAIDLPGFGKSSDVAEVHTMEMMAKAVYEVLSHLNTGQVVITGHSMGGYAALAFAASHPEKMKGLVIFHSHAAADSEEARINRDRAIRAVAGSHKTFVHTFIPALFAKDSRIRLLHDIEQLQMRAGKISPASIIAALEGMKVRVDRQGVLRKAGFPVAFIAGKEDSRMPLNVMMEQASLPMHSETLILGNVGHMGFLEAKEKTMAFIRFFAQRSFSG